MASWVRKVSRPIRTTGCNVADLHLPLGNYGEYVMVRDPATLWIVMVIPCVKDDG
jgi:hypothetical protein